MGKSFRIFLIFILQNKSVIFLATFLFALSIIFLRRTSHILLSLIASILISYVATYYFPNQLIILALFLPSIIHVYFFTLFFILFGSIKSKSKMGIYSVLVLITIPFIIYYIPIFELGSYQSTNGAIDTFVQSNIKHINATIAKLLGGLQNGKFILLSEIGLRIQIFIAFAYTYHYLNWFSKTSIIGWKKSLTKEKLLSVLAIWAFSVGLYIYDYSTGLTALFFLSTLHVLLEFPLNCLTIKEVFKSVSQLFKTKGISIK